MLDACCVHGKVKDGKMHLRMVMNKAQAISAGSVDVVDFCCGMGGWNGVESWLVQRLHRAQHAKIRALPLPGNLSLLILN